jgi:4-hydroxy-2-oxoheptanedioate aldolase
MIDLRKRWNDGGVAVGGWVSIANTVTTEVMARSGFDYVCIDNQHGLVEYRDTVTLLQVLGLGDSAPLVRVPWNEPGIIGKMLDAGAGGVIVPMVNSPEEAAAAVAAMRYHPDGARSYGPTGVSLRHADYYGSANAAVLCVPMIETTTAVARIDDIVSVPGVDVVYVGPADLSVTLGLPPRNNDDDPRFVEALEAIVASCRRSGVVAGCHATPDLVARRAEMGFQMITAVADIGTFRAAVAAALGVASPDSGGSGY